MRCCTSRRTISVLLVMFSLLFAPTNSRASDLFMTSGTKCAKLGSKTTVKKISYTCTKKGKSFVWTKTKSSGTPSAGSSGSAGSSQNSGWSYDYQKSVWVSQGASQKFDRLFNLVSLAAAVTSHMADFVGPNMEAMSAELLSQPRLMVESQWLLTTKWGEFISSQSTSFIRAVLCFASVI